MGGGGGGGEGYVVEGDLGGAHRTGCALHCGLRDVWGWRRHGDGVWVSGGGQWGRVSGGCGWWWCCCCDDVIIIVIFDHDIICCRDLLFFG